MHATASARFAMEIWRAVLAVAIRNPKSVSLPIDQYIGATTSAPFVIVSDASPTGMCVALYHPVTGVLVAWGEFKFPYDRDVRAQYQGNREHLGYLFLIIALIAHTPAHTTTRQYKCINDNIGAIQWAAAQKCSSMASHFANLAVTQLHIIAHLRMVPTVHKPGIEMGEIDTMSRIAAHKNPTMTEIQQRCPTLTPTSYHAQFTTRTTAEAVPATRLTFLSRPPSNNKSRSRRERSARTYPGSASTWKTKVSIPGS